MTYRVEISSRAARDFALIFYALRADDLQAAERWFHALRNLILNLEQVPGLIATSHEDPSLRQLIYGNKRSIYHVIFYIDDLENCVTVFQVRQSNQNAR